MSVHWLRRLTLGRAGRFYWMLWVLWWIIILGPLFCRGYGAAS